MKPVRQYVRDGSLDIPIALKDSVLQVHDFFYSTAVNKSPRTFIRSHALKLNMQIIWQSLIFSRFS